MNEKPMDLEDVFKRTIYNRRTFDAVKDTLSLFTPADRLAADLERFLNTCLQTGANPIETANVWKEMRGYDKEVTDRKKKLLEDLLGK